MKGSLKVPASGSIAAAILVAWSLSAAYLGQSLFATQRSLSLIQLGGATGALFDHHEWWRLLVSQFLHVHFLHMIFNATCIALVGGLIERSYGWRALLVVYLIGGTSGQVASVLSYPLLVSDGASQALMSLCDAGILLLSQPLARVAALAIIAVQVALDWRAVGAIKAGHSVGFCVGAFIAACILGILRFRSATAMHGVALPSAAPKSGPPIEP